MAARVAALGLAVAGVAMLVFVGMYVVDAAVDNSQHDVTVVNESFTPSGGEVTQLQNSNLSRADYDDNVTVRFENGTVVDRAGNYTWFSGNGTVRTTAGSRLASVSTALITYGYNGHTLEQTAIVNISIETMSLLKPMVLAAFVALLLAGLAVLGRVS